MPVGFPDYYGGLTLPVTVPEGGTGQTSVTAGAVLYGAGTSKLVETNVGTANQVLTIDPITLLPTWEGSGATPTFNKLSLSGTVGNDILLFTGGGADSIGFDQYGDIHANAAAGGGDKWSVIDKAGTYLFNVNTDGTNLIHSPGTIEVNALKVDLGTTPAVTITTDAVEPLTVTANQVGAAGGYYNYATCLSPLMADGSTFAFIFGTSVVDSNGGSFG